jgi:NAD-dependent SIR2 family protein deacetylase
MLQELLSQQVELKHVTTTVRTADYQETLSRGEFKASKAQVDWTLMHGRLGNDSWDVPLCVTECNQSARPGYAQTKAHEYSDVPEVLRAKIAQLANMIRSSRHCMVYSGAGISTAAGIADYASVSAETKGARPDAQADQKRLSSSPMAAQPTLSHRVLVGLHRAGMLKCWVQQNHDGLPQKAGLPQYAINEIHGALYDPSNPVIPMSGVLRSDLFADFETHCQQADLCVALGTSLAGMNADQCVERCAQRLQRNNWDTRSASGPLFGSVIIGLQRTQHDAMASLRIFARLDDCMRLLAAELELTSLMPAEGFLYTLPSTLPASQVLGNDVYLVPYNAEGEKLPGSPRIEDMLRWDLSEDAKVKITAGQHKGDMGDVIGRSLDKHIKIRFFHPIGKKNFKAPMERTLGMWWIQAAVEGTVPLLPVVNA